LHRLLPDFCADSLSALRKKTSGIDPDGSAGTSELAMLVGSAGNTGCNRTADSGHSAVAAICFAVLLFALFPANVRRPVNI
jgi:hypothetical protein